MERDALPPVDVTGLLQLPPLLLLVLLFALLTPITLETPPLALHPLGLALLLPPLELALALLLLVLLPKTGPLHFVVDAAAAAAVAVPVALATEPLD